jgi:hypothetical protein
VDDVTLYLALLGGFFVVAGGFVAFMAHREWDREARESDEASHTAAE